MFNLKTYNFGHLELFISMEAKTVFIRVIAKLLYIVRTCDFFFYFPEASEACFGSKTFRAFFDS